MSDALTLDLFSPHVGTSFEVTPSGPPPIVLGLTTAKRLGMSDEGLSRIPFSLLFHHPGEKRHFPQQTVRLQHAALGEIEIFLVPLGPDEVGMRYEAVFT